MATAAEEISNALTSLQPIRDLAKNWDIDIAACLEEFLHDLASGLDDLDHPHANADTLNFSQAAMVLHNSSNVYSRKVEYLYNLVLQVYEDLRKNAGSKKNKDSAKKTAADVELEEFTTFDPQVQFLLLDDVLPTDDTGKSINLQKETNDNGPREMGTSFATARSTTRLSLGATFATERSGSSGHSMANRFGFGSIQNAGRLRLIDGKCDLGQDGILIVPGAGGTLIAGDRHARRSSFLPSPLRDDNNHDTQDTAPKMDFEDNQSTSGGVMDFGFDDGDDVGGGGFALADDDNGSVGAAENTENNNPQTKATTEPSDVPNGQKPKVDDPWALLDPHFQDPSGPKRRPLRIANTSRLPPGVTEYPSQLVTGARTKKPPRQAKASKLPSQKARCIKRPYVVEALRAKLAAHRDLSNDNVPTAPEIPLHGLVYGDEFAYIAKEMSRRKAKLRKAERARSNKADAYYFQDDDDDDDGDAGGHFFGNNNDDGYGSPDLGGGDDGMFVNDDGDDAFDGAGVDLAESMSMTESTDGNVGTKTFEELCRAHVQEFARTASAYANETRLSKRVGEWHERLVPILELEENRHEFDIHQYTQRVVDTILDAGDRKGESNDKAAKLVDFHEATRNCPRYEVCRLFLASLSLANSGNIRLHHNHGDPDLHIELVESEITNPMEAYFAPSVLQED
ncbi:Condensin-2 complex subunit H2 [Seminavis robusta]|uniref:Condensin-2 complex subunit H2 n=1 Tax=Seminavis robusta TaxID=568900 RepID=A0A9N8EW27_9STRA|nr:Condensin-2 complex subunit H2 [Seminavis robusta]|eukprot:Sro1857_g302030.1 Condensin-2 complex subunit H2 (681) ;mRNA; r:3405-5791